MTSTSDYDHLAKREFIENILKSDYTICMRGVGNYSYRFYETLALGRVPIFINTDCQLPWDEMIQYKGQFPWIDQREIAYAVEKVLDFHHRICPEEFVGLQAKCRELWMRHFTYERFYGDWVNYFEHGRILQ